MAILTKLFPILALALVATSVASAAAPAAPPQSMSLRGRRMEAMEYQAMMAGATPQCFIENGWDYVGNDLGNEPGSVDQCCDKCYNRRGCQAWTWTNFNGGTCWLKVAVTEIKANAGAKSALFFFGSRPRCQLVDGYDMPGFDIGSVKASKAEDCCAKCQGYAGCRAYSWSNYEGGTCWLKSAASEELVAKAGVKSAAAFSYSDNDNVCASALPDTDFEGNDIGNQQNVRNPELCCGICRATDNCRAYSWTRDNGGTCYLKSKTGNKISKQGVISAQLFKNPDEACSTAPQFDYVGYDIGNAPSASADKCCTQCRAFGGCKAWTWSSYNGGTCWFKNAFPFFAYSPSVVSGTIY